MDIQTDRWADRRADVSKLLRGTIQVFGENWLRKNKSFYLITAIERLTIDIRNFRL